ncbi:MAG: hypothetical protein KC933_17075 [Myxococcales bacterium]|nr:hypothetical protein [Myxococcales bacterium]MCB9647916.1 hypothetical protein [Deltaproteobacteria bacterium]
MIATEHLTPVLEALDLSGILNTLDHRAREAAERKLSYEEFLYRVLHDAVAHRRAADPAPAIARLRAAPRLTVEDEARRFEVGGRRPVDLSRRGPIRRILVALVQAHQAGRALDVTEVVSAGWPGEIVPPDAGATRVYTAIRTLRRLGLEGVLLTRDSGYLLDPRTVLHAA